MKAMTTQNSMMIFFSYSKERFQNFFNDLDTFLEIDDELELRTRVANLRKNVSNTKTHMKIHTTSMYNLLWSQIETEIQFEDDKIDFNDEWSKSKMMVDLTNLFIDLRSYFERPDKDANTKKSPYPEPKILITNTDDEVFTTEGIEQVI